MEAEEKEFYIRTFFDGTENRWAGGSTRVKHYYRDVKVGIRVIDEKSAPVVFDWKNYGSDNEVISNNYLRFYNGKYYQCFKDHKGEEIKLEKLQPALETSSLNILRNGYLDGCKTSKLPNLADAMITSEREDWEFKKAHELASDMLVVDSKVYLRVGSPKIIVGRNGVKISAGLIDTNDYEKDRRVNRVFILTDKLKSIISVTDNAAVDHILNLDLRGVDSVRSMNIHSSLVAENDAYYEVAMFTAQSIIKWMEHYRMKDLPDKLIEQFLSLRKCVNFKEFSNDDMQRDAVSNAVLEICNTLINDRFELEGFTHGWKTTLEEYSSLARAYIENVNVPLSEFSFR